MDYKIGMLFLFDIKGSTEVVHMSNSVEQKSYYDFIEAIVKNVTEEINNNSNEKVFIAQYTGDGFYFFSQDPAKCLDLYIGLTAHFDSYSFKGQPIKIRCGAVFGNLNFSTAKPQELKCDLANRTSRVCDKSDIGELTVDDHLYNLICQKPILGELGFSHVKRVAVSLKGIGKADLWKIKRSNFHRLANELFVGRNKILSDFTIFLEEHIKLKSIVSIVGGSGVGKTSLAIAAIKNIENWKCVLIDLRVIKTIKDIHKIILDVVWDDLAPENQRTLATFESKQSIFSLIASINYELIIVVDHAEMLMSKELSDIKTLLFENYEQLRTVITSTIAFDFPVISQYPLSNPTNSEKLDMLTHWIKAKRAWIQDIATKITNHTILVVQFGNKCKGVYKTKKALQAMASSIVTESNTEEYFHSLIELQCERICGWIFLAYMNDGIISTDLIPSEAQIKLIEQFMPTKNHSEFSFHPLIMEAVRKYYADTIITDTALKVLSAQPYSPVAEYYKFQLHRRKTDGIEVAKKILLDSWQTWAEEINSYKAIVSIDALATNYSLEISEIEQYNMFLAIIRIFQGQSHDLNSSCSQFETLMSSISTPAVLKLLAIAEFIECKRKTKGNVEALNLIESHLYTINDLLQIVTRNSYKYYAKNYYIGTFYFLIGNILRSSEDEMNAITFYRKAMEHINLCEKEHHNAELQKMHITYGISEAYLKSMQVDRSIETVDEFFRVNSNGAKFGSALMWLLKARAYLAKDGAKYYARGKVAVKIASSLFSEIKLAYYIDRCKLVLAALHYRSNAKVKATKLLSELLLAADDVGKLLTRAKILNCYITHTGITSTQNEILKIVEQRGWVIGSFFAFIAQVDLPSESRINKTVRLKNNSLVLDEISASTFSSAVPTWIID